MGTIWLRDIKGGLDTRRMAEALPGGSAIRANDGHITRGGEFEQRPAFVDAYTLPAAQTIGLAFDNSGLYVFGDGAAPTMPRGVTYQRLQHPDGTTPLTRILNFDLYQKKIYVVAEFGDGTIYHFYDGTRIADWQDGRARVSFTVTGGGLQPATHASGSFTINGGSASIVNTFGDIKVNGVSIIGAPVQHTGDNTTSAAAVASAVNSYSSVPEYTATSLGAVVTIVATATGPAVNGLSPVVTLNGDTSITAITAFAGGADAVYSSLTDLTVNGVSILAAAVDWTTSNAATAQAIADSINTYASVPDYTASVVDNKVNLLAANPGTGSNGYAVAFTLANGMVVTPSVGVVLANGLAPGNVFQSGSFAKTVGSKVYVANQEFLNFSGIRRPTGFQTEATEPLNVGAGFIDMSTEYAGSEALQAIAKYLQYIAVLAARVIQIWYVDPDPDLNKPAQVLPNTGTRSPRSVTNFGDSDLFYLDESGVRSLRSRDASTAASTTDVGIPIDTLIVAKLATLSTLERSRVIGLIEPTAGRFWLIFADEIFVLSFFAGSKISAWSTYTPAINGEAFDIDDAVVFNKKVYLRSGDAIKVFGGLGASPVYDATEPELWVPYLDADSPAVSKDFKAIDVACEGSWEVRVALESTDQAASDKVGIVTKTTYNGDTLPWEHSATHVSLRFKGVGSGAKKIAAAAIHFEGGK